MVLVNPSRAAVASSVFSSDGRRRLLEIDDATWILARGFALDQALRAVPYYPETNPAFVAVATRTIEEVLGDSQT